MSKEATARIKINKLLEESGWRFFDTEEGKANISLENNVKITKDMIDEFGEDFKKTEDGFVDFLLLDDNKFPIVVLEAKSEDKNPLIGKEQARRYAQSLNVRFVILSNGNLHYFWDIETDNPKIITKFPTLESLKHNKEFKPNKQSLINEIVEDDYLVLTQNNKYKEQIVGLTEEEKVEYYNKNGLRFFRKYQLDAIKSIQSAVSDGKSRFLFEMATGTGKTMVSAGIIKLFLKTSNAKRVLFLVDRLELEEQAYKNFNKYLSKDYTTVIYKENKGDWQKAEIVVTTVQSLLFNDKYKKKFSPTDFDLVISDEAHRSINGNSRAVFEYFIGYKLGLTATPKNYLRNIKKSSRMDAREIERRQLLDTYKTFGCESGQPTFSYSLIDGVKDGYLINPITVDARTEITTQLLSDEGYSVLVEDDEGNKEQKIFFNRDFEKNFFSDKTNIAFCETFMKNALKDPLSGEIGKTIIFCVSQNHAIKITQILNELAHKNYPEKYNSDFAITITSMFGKEAQQNTINFANNNLLGNTKWLEGYKSSKVRVCVTVGMMTTGYDCTDILNLCLMRPIFSPSDFVQIKGRGTRRNTFEYKDRHKEIHKLEKKKFKLFDFFANCEYFEEKYNYDEIIKLPKTRSKSTENVGVEVSNFEYDSAFDDKTIIYEEAVIGNEGMKIDRKLYEKFEDEVKNNEEIRTNMKNGNFDRAEEIVRKEIFDKPTDYITLDKLRKVVKLDRRLTLKEILQKAFGFIDKFKSKDELLEDEFEKFVSIYREDIDKYLEKKPDVNIIKLKNYFKSYATDTNFRNIVDSKEFARLSDNPKFSIDDLMILNGWKEVVPEYIKDYVSLNKFVA